VGTENHPLVNNNENRTKGKSAGGGRGWQNRERCPFVYKKAIVKKSGFSVKQQSCGPRRVHLKFLGCDSMQLQFLPLF
jgi:hypothetical protein